MNDFAPPYTLTDRMLLQISAISEKIGRISAHYQQKTAFPQLTGKAVL